MKRIYILLTLLSTLLAPALTAKAGDWVLHPTYDSNTHRIIDTPERTYFLGYAQPYVPTSSTHAEPMSFVFYYDKENDEVLGLTKRTDLSDNVVAFAEYNPDKRYLLVVYSNSNIDLIFDNGEVRNIPGLMSATMPISKRVNWVTFWPEADQAWLATDFGYLCINDVKAEISESRNFGTALESVGRMGDTLFITRDGVLSSAPVANANFNLSDFKPVADFSSPARFLPLADNKGAVYAMGDGNMYAVTVLSGNPVDGYNQTVVARSYRTWLTPNRDGYMLSGGDNMQQVFRDGTRITRSRYADDTGKMVGSWDFKEFWFVDEREGFYTRAFGDNSVWTLTRGHIQPNAPAAFMCQDMVYHPRYGMLVSNHGLNEDFSGATIPTPILLSGLKGGEWTKYGPAYNNKAQADIIWNPNGLAVDPDNSDYVYFGSRLHGMARISLSDPDDILHMSHPSDRSAALDGFVAIVPDKDNVNYKFSDPKFDAVGNLWTAYYNHDSDKVYELWCWLADDRRASVDAASFREWKKIPLDYDSGNTDVLLPLRAPANRGLVLACGNKYDAPLLIVDTNGTIADTSDDTVVSMGKIYDQDGSDVEHHYIKCFYEDLSSGVVWVGTSTGVFTLQPRTALSNPSRVTRIKVSRNDGTDLADYLLDGVDICRIMDDGRGRKWFATKGAGLVCTTSDGRTIIEEITAENSWLPSNTVYGVGYDQSDGSIMISTDQGLAQYFPSGSTSGDNMDEVRAYPNPVRPDYFGYVTIDGLVNGALVKVSDSAGNLVKELGFAEGGQVQWDVTNHSNVRVKSGVYFILASSGPGDTNLAHVTKVLVIN